MRTLYYPFLFKEFFKHKKRLGDEAFFDCWSQLLVAGEVSEGLISLGHLMSIFTLLNSVTGVVKGI